MIHMKPVSFLTDQKKQVIVDNVESLKNAILAAYDPVSFEESGGNVRISPVNNVRCGLVIETSHDFSKAVLGFEVRSPKDFFGVLRTEVKSYTTEELQKIATERYGAVVKVNNMCDVYVKIDVTELTIEVLSAIEKVLKVSGLKPRAVDNGRVRFG